MPCPDVCGILQNGVSSLCPLLNLLSRRMTEKSIPVIPEAHPAYLQSKGVKAMKEKIRMKNTFKTTDPVLLRKAVTAKMEKLVHAQVKKAG